MTTPELKPCPFCGGNNMRVNNIPDAWPWSVECEDCASSSNFYTEKQEAINAWNRRAK